MSLAHVRPKVEVWDEREESRCREATLLAKDDRGSMSRSGMLIREFCRQRSLREEPVLLVATQTEGPPSATERADLLGGSSKLCAGQ